jgi:hypothetical protein
MIPSNMIKYIYQSKSLPPVLCHDIIHLFEQDNDRYKGLTRGGLNVDTKDTMDLFISDKEHWTEINEILTTELNKHIKKYLIQLNNEFNIRYNYDLSYDMIDTEVLINNGFMVQKYDQNKGKYKYHNDFNTDYSSYKCRKLTYLWYLNDITEGGETEFWGNYIIKPQTGKLILFPASWTFPHCGKMPVSSDKYIITGWLYT